MTDKGPTRTIVVDIENMGESKRRRRCLQD